MNFFMDQFGLRGGDRPQSRQRRIPQYHDSFQAYPAYMLERSDLEKGNRILLPAYTLNLLSNYQMPYPMIFCLQNTVNGKQTFVGVLEFIAPEGSCYIPFWIFQMLDLYEGQQLNVSLVPDMIKGRLIKIQPHETAFIDLPDPRAILEKELPNYTSLHQGDTIVIEFMKKQYKIDILEVQPKNSYNAICVTDADIEVDFAKPLDYVDMPQPQLGHKTSSVNLDEQTKLDQKKGNKVFSGTAVRIDGKKVDQKKLQEQMTKELQKKIDEDLWDPRKHRLPHGVRKQIIINEFKGTGIKLGMTKK